MQSTVRPPVAVQCIAGGHDPVTVAQFRHDADGGWGRIHNNGQTDLLWEPSDSDPKGVIRVKYHAKCALCGRDFEFRGERLYRHLDWALANAKPIKIG